MKPLLITAFAIILNIGIVLLPGQAVYRQAPPPPDFPRLTVQYKSMQTLDTIPVTPQDFAQKWLRNYNLTNQYDCLVTLWNGESGWRVDASNTSSGAYGIPQSLPASKMASVGNDYLTNPETQIHWGIGYIVSSYGTPCNALAQWQARYPHWY